MANSGYENVLYISHHNESEYLSFIIMANDPTNFIGYRFIDFYPELGWYLFVADKSGEEYAILVHVGRGEIDAACIVEETGPVRDAVKR